MGREGAAWFSGTAKVEASSSGKPGGPGYRVIFLFDQYFPRRLNKRSSCSIAGARAAKTWKSVLCRRGR